MNLFVFVCALALAVPLVANVHASNAPGTLLDALPSDGSWGGWVGTGGARIAGGVFLVPSSATLASPAFAQGADRVVLSWSAGSGSDSLSIELRDAANAPVMRLDVDGNKLCAASGHQRCFPDDLNGASHRVEIGLASLAVTFDDVQTLNAARLGSGAPDHVFLGAASGTLALNDARVYAAGVSADAPFARSDAPQGVTFESYAASAQGVGAPLPSASGLPIAIATRIAGAHERGVVQVQSLGAPTDLAFGAAARPTSARFFAQVSYKPFTSGNVPDGMALLAGLGDSSGPGDVKWAIVQSPSAPRELLGQQTGSVLRFVDGTRDVVLASTSGFANWGDLRAVGDVDAGTLRVTWRGALLGTLTGVALGDSTRIAFGDVSAALAGPDSGDGTASFDDFVVAPLG